MELNINEHHRQEIFTYLRFWRYQRTKRVKSVVYCFEDIKNSRLRGETTFTIDEVNDILEELLSLVKGEMETELIGTGHTNVLLLKQLFSQAEKWHLKLQTNISELENRELLDEIKEFEDVEFAGVKVDKDLAELIKTTKLSPMNDTGSTALLHSKIEELEKENSKLLAALRTVEQQAKGLSKEQENLKNQQAASASSKEANKQQDIKLHEMQSQISMLLQEVDMAKKDKEQKTTELSTDLTKTKHELLKVQDTLAMAEKELEKKVQETAPFKNMKQMLLKKNDQIKELRTRLCKYEPE